MSWTMRNVGLTFDDAPARAGPCTEREGAAGALRLRDLVEEHYDFVWRSLRRLGVRQGDVDDAAQRVFLTAHRKLDGIRSGSEKSFLFQTALRVAADSRRTVRRRRELGDDPDETLEAPVPGTDELVDLRRARARLDQILDEMPLELRAVFVLFELDEMTMAEIAALLDLPAGTVASRLRRARQEFRARVARPPLPRNVAPGGAR